MFISNSEVRAILKKGYVIIFILGIISLIIGLVLTSLIGFIPSVNYGDPGYEEYHDLILNMNSLFRIRIIFTIYFYWSCN